MGVCTQLWFPVCGTTKYHAQRKVTVFFCKLKKIMFDSWKVYCRQIKNNTTMY